MRQIAFLDPGPFISTNAHPGEKAGMNWPTF